MMLFFMMLFQVRGRLYRPPSMLSESFKARMCIASFAPLSNHLCSTAKIFVFSNVMVWLDFQAIRREDFSTEFSQTIRRKLTDYSTVYNSTDRLFDGIQFDGQTIRRKDHSTEISLSLFLSLSLSLIEK